MARRIAAGYAFMALLLAGGPAAAEGAQGTLTLRATVPASCAVSLSADNVVLNLNSASATSVPVATVEERCNAANGYSISVTSKNGGALSSGTATIAYSLQYGDSNSGTDGAVVAGRTASGAPRQTVLSVTVPGAQQRQAGDYQDVVTIAIAAK